jgi:formamidopyrimidine-DNA glycosylase
VADRVLGDAWAFPHPKFLPALDAAGATVVRLERRGKYLLFRLHDDRDLVVHLGMTGSLQIRAPADVRRDPYVRAWWGLNAALLAFRDVRRFGRLAVVKRDEHTGTLAVQGPDALDPTLTAEDLWRALRASRRAVKTQLLSQRPLAGVGNIYADEALWLARVHPAKRSVSRVQAADLLEAIREVLTTSMENDGTTFRDYRTANGEPGRNRERLACYGRAGLPCVSCGSPLRRTVLDGRTTTWCPTCQRR